MRAAGLAWRVPSIVTAVCYRPAVPPSNGASPPGRSGSLRHGVHHDAGRGAGEAPGVVLATIALDPRLAFRFGPARERRPLALVGEQRDAEAAGRLHEVHVERHDLPRAD